MKIGMKELREKQREMFAAVKAGQHVVVTRDGVAVAGVVPAWEMAMLETLTVAEWEGLKVRAAEKMAGVMEVEAIEPSAGPKLEVVKPASAIPATEIPAHAVCGHQTRGGICGAKAIFARGTRFFCQEH